MRVLVPLSIASAVIGCVEPPSQPDPEPQPASSIAVLLANEDCRAGDTCNLDFGEVPADGATLELEIVNYGDGEAVLDAFVLTGSDAFSVADAPTTVQPFSHATFTLTAAPPAAVAFHSDLTIVGNEEPIELELVAQRVPGGIDVTSPCMFGDVPVGTASAPCDVVFTNRTTDDVEINEASIDGEVFSTTSILALPASVPPGGALTVEVVATPVELGLNSAPFWVVLGDGSRIQMNLVVNGI